MITNLSGGWSQSCCARRWPQAWSLARQAQPLIHSPQEIVFMQRAIPLAVLALCAGFTAHLALAQDQAGGNQAGDAAKAFMQKLDTDGSGGISLEEATAPQKEQFKENDADGDGFITADEASAAFAEQVPPEMMEAMKERGMPEPGETFVKNLDQNEDGKVDPTEFEQPTKESFAAMDKNGDGIADEAEATAYFEEMRAKMQERMQQMQQQMQQMQQSQPPATE
jgi:Ca2+-binding EF-hand superfamily protein